MTLDTQTKANQSQIFIKMHTTVKNSSGYSLLKVLTADFLITIKIFFYGKTSHKRKQFKMHIWCSVIQWYNPHKTLCIYTSNTLKKNGGILLPGLINVHTQEDNVNMHENFVDMQFTDQFRHSVQNCFIYFLTPMISCKIQHIYVGMRLHSVNMRLIYVDMQVNYVKLKICTFKSKNIM